MKLRAMDEADVPFVHDCLRELRGAAEYTVAQLTEYLATEASLRTGACTILVGEVGSERVGLLTCNRYAMPRYLGYGIELEEVVVHPSHQRQGHGAAMLDAFLAGVSADPQLRRVTVRTDDARRAGVLYAKFFARLECLVFSRGVHRL
jgi:GNAT superfamily N-acetyltransferase